MKLTANSDHEFAVETRLGNLDPDDALKVLVAQNEQELCELESRCALAHPRLCNARYGRKVSIQTLLIAVMELGYEVTIAKPPELVHE